MIKGYNVYRNDQFVKFIPSRSEKALHDFIKNDAVIGTHMGEWSRSLIAEAYDAEETAFELTYSTTVGAYFTFKPAVT